MKKQIKKCLGFDYDLCTKCKRQDKNSERLVEFLAVYPNSEKKYCNLFIKL